MPLVARWGVDPAQAAASAVVPGLWRLKLPLAWPEIPHANAWAIERADGGLLLVDCAMYGPGAFEALERALREAGFGIEDVKVLAGTHAHADHIGLASVVVHHSGASFLLHPSYDHLYEAVREPRRIEAARRRWARRAGVPDDALGVYEDVEEEEHGVAEPLEPDGLLTPGVVLESRLGPWQVVETPGHAPSHVVLWQPDRGLVVSGDLVTRIFAPWYDLGYTPDPVGEYLASLDVVSALGASVLLPGHGRPLDEPEAVLEMHRQGVADRLDAVAAAVDGGATTAYDVAGVVHGMPEAGLDGLWNLGETLAYLWHLRRSGRPADDLFNQTLGR